MAYDPRSITVLQPNEVQVSHVNFVGSLTHREDEAFLQRIDIFANDGLLATWSSLNRNGKARILAELLPKLNFKDKITLCREIYNVKLAHIKDSIDNVD